MLIMIMMMMMMMMMTKGVKQKVDEQVTEANMAEKLTYPFVGREQEWLNL